MANMVLIISASFLSHLLLLSSRWLPVNGNNYNFHLVNHTCLNNTNYTSTPLFRQTLSILLQNLSIKASTEAFSYETANIRANESVHASYLCRGDIANDFCDDCVTKAREYALDKCSSQHEAVVWYEHCMVRFSDQPFLGHLNMASPRYNCNVYDVNVDDVEGFNTTLWLNLENVSVEAADDKVEGMKYATKDFEIVSYVHVYSLEQCTPDLSVSDCGRCLKESIRVLQGIPCIGKQGGRVLLPSCNIRYETYTFYKGKKKRKPIWMIAAISAIPATLICIFVCFVLYKKKSDEFPSAVDMDGITSSVRSLQFDLSMIKATTDNFSSDKMLGQGGFGAVYKGRLENGQEVAIKRLSGNSVQGIEEFKTEVAVVAKLQHRNLVKLLGFCLSKKEKILIYEYLSNSSLDKVLLDPVRRKSLDWATRSKIILGIAKGLLYLHQDSRLKIIHRDLKSSNILLDDTLNAKISDFGLARMLGVDQTQDGTNRIIGTYGYMAPEYAMTGHFSVKSDVYSFGIIVLELVSGQVNRFFNRPQFEEALLLRAWRLWEEEAAMELVDPCFGNDYPMEEVAKCIHMGLLCIQGKAARRPDMSFVVGLLSGQSVELPPVAPSALSSASNLCSVEESLEVGESQEVHNEKPTYV